MFWRMDTTYLCRKGWSFHSCRICTRGILIRCERKYFEKCMVALTSSVEGDDMVALTKYWSNGHRL
jgi:hypothetical protein